MTEIGTEEIVTGTAIVSVSGIVTVTKIVNVTGNVTEIVTATVTAKRNVGNTEVGHAKKTVIVIATVTGEKMVFFDAFFDVNFCLVYV